MLGQDVDVIATLMRRAQFRAARTDSMHTPPRSLTPGFPRGWPFQCRRQPRPQGRSCAGRPHNLRPAQRRRTPGSEVASRRPTAGFLPLVEDGSGSLTPSPSAAGHTVLRPWKACMPPPGGILSFFREGQLLSHRGTIGNPQGSARLQPCLICSLASSGTEVSQRRAREHGNQFALKEPPACRRGSRASRAPGDGC